MEDQKMGAQPVVSVVMAVYNGLPFLDAAIRSVREQNFADFEIIIVNDGSTDGSGVVLAAHARDDSRVRIIEQENRGLVRALNRGLSVARGRYIARMDADDLALPDRFTKQVRFLDAHPDIAVVGGAIELIDESDRPLGIVRYPLTPDEVRERLLEGSPLAHPAVMMRRSVIEEAGGYRPQYRYAQDYDLWLRLAERHHLANLPDVLVRYREHLGKVSLTNYPQQLVAGIAARYAAACRRAAQADPTDRLTRLDFAALKAIGMPHGEERAARDEIFRALFIVAAEGRFPVWRLARLWLAEDRRMPLSSDTLRWLIKFSLSVGYNRPRRLPQAAILLALISIYHPLVTARYLGYLSRHG
jgi:glycosyltransferase involved in cell wall biosynthesis